MAATKTSAEQFAWETQPAAARWVQRAIESLVKRQPTLDRLRRVLREQTGTRLVDWVDHFWLGSEETSALCRELAEVGYVADGGDGRHGVAASAGNVSLCVDRWPGRWNRATRRVGRGRLGGVAGGDWTWRRDSVGKAIGERAGRFVGRELDAQNGVGLWIIERHGHPGFRESQVGKTEIEAAARHLEAFRGRQRRWATNDEGFDHALELFAAASKVIGSDWASDLFFQAEREYWQGRNRAGRVQYERQNRLGLGWANHDHHTYRSSRNAFPRLVATLEQMGFECRERFYAGREAGWGAQVLEQPRSRVVIFADVDLTPDEVAADFAHQPFGECELGLGTVGLWCELHGEAFLEAGMHHLECQFDFDAARAAVGGRWDRNDGPVHRFSVLEAGVHEGRGVAG